MSETLIGVIIGAVAAIIGGIIGALLSYLLERKRQRYELMRKAYEAAEHCIIETTGCPQNRDARDYLNTVDKMAVTMSLYAKPDTLEMFERISDLITKDKKTDKDLAELKRLDDVFDQMIRYDLHIDCEFFVLSRSPIFRFFRHLFSSKSTHTS